MFKQRYNKRKRKTILRKKSSKNEIKREDRLEKFNKIGLDDSVSKRLYNWLQIAPTLSPTKMQGMAKLKQLCAESIAFNVDAIDSIVLDHIPLHIVKYIWKFVLIYEQDSIFAWSIFSKYPVQPHINTDKLKDRVISLYKIPNKFHRVENIFRNIDLSDLLVFLQSFKPYLILEFSLIGQLQSNEEYFRLFNVPNLICLNLSGHAFVDDIYINNLCISLKDGKLRLLTIIKLNNTNITKHGLITLFKSWEYSNISCIESSITLDTDDFAWIKLEKDASGKILQKLPLGLKLSALIKQSRVDLKIDHQNILDLMIINDDFNQETDGQTELDSGWLMRQRARQIIQVGETYLLDRNKSMNQDLDIDPVVEVSIRQPQKRKKLIKTNAADFFN